MTAHPTEATSITICLPAPDGLGSLQVSRQLDEAGRPQSLDIQYRLSPTDSPSHWLPASVEGPLRLVLDASDAICGHVPRAEMYLEDRICPQCNFPLIQGDGLGGKPCYECVQDNLRRQREGAAQVGEL